MGFNKRYINKENLHLAKKQGLDYLIKFIKNPDCLFIEDDFSDKICQLVRKTKNKNTLKQKLIEIGFYESQ